MFCAVITSSRTGSKATRPRSTGTATAAAPLPVAFAPRRIKAETASSNDTRDQLRGPFENLLQGLAVLCHHDPGTVIAVGESTVSDLRTRPDYDRATKPSAVD